MNFDKSLEKGIILNWTLWIIVFVILVVTNIIFISKYISASKRANLAEATISIRDNSSKVLDFTNLFIEKVLQAKGEISFDERLIMENAVRDLKDSEISTQWQKFVQSKEETAAQIEVTNLLKLLVEKAKN